MRGAPIFERLIRRFAVEGSSRSGSTMPLRCRAPPSSFGTGRFAGSSVSPVACCAAWAIGCFIASANGNPSHPRRDRSIFVVLIQPSAISHQSLHGDPETVALHVEIHPDTLDLRVVLERMHAHLAPEAALLVAA